MSATNQILEGTWEEIRQHEARLAGKRLRVEVLEESNGAEKSSELPFYLTATKEERIRALREWALSHRRDSPLLSEAAISRESIYFGEE